MDVVVLSARLMLAVIFAAAGIAKLADTAGARRALIGFGVPTRLAPPVAVLLPLAELGTAAALLPAGTARVGAVGAAILLLLFVVAVAVNLALGRKPDCHCFGQVHSTPIGTSTLVRNLALTGVAGLVLSHSDTQPGFVGELGRLTPGQGLAFAAGLALLAVIAVQTWLLLNLLRQNGRILLRLDALEAALPHTPTPHHGGLPVGTTAPGFDLEDLSGDRVPLGALLSDERPALLVFSDPDCGPCQALLPEIGRWQREHGERLTIAVVSRRSAEDNVALAAEHGLANVLLQRDREVAEAYRVAATPSAVVVLPDGFVGSSAAAGVDAIRALLARALAGELPAPSEQAHHAPPPPPSVEVGEPAPEVALPDVEGMTARLSDYRGSDVVVLFWNPKCGFCQRMLPDLRAWDAAPPRRAPALLVVSEGTVEENRAMGLRSTVVLDEGFTAGRAFGASGTPSAVLVDAEGRVASAVTIGAPDVLDLLRRGGRAAHASRA